jgi:hypothetical protein
MYITTTPAMRQWLADHGIAWFVHSERYELRHGAWTLIQEASISVSDAQRELF